jgi:hypothetical protein
MQDRMDTYATRWGELADLIWQEENISHQSEQTCSLASGQGGRFRSRGCAQ